MDAAILLKDKFMNKAIIFDLDGTLINSIGGIAYSVNLTRKFYSLPPQPDELIASFIGNGIRKLMERSLARDENSTVALDDAVKTMSELYTENPLAETFLYPGVKETLVTLAQSNWHLAVVTNKPQNASEKILQGLGIRELFDENIGGGGDFPLKPEPDALYYLIKKYHIDPEYCFVAGDNYTDLDFAANGNVKSIFCTWGFGHPGSAPATFTINSFPEILGTVASEQ